MIVNSIIPKLIAFKSLLIIRNIGLRKQQERKLAREKEMREEKRRVAAAAAGFGGKRVEGVVGGEG